MASSVRSAGAVPRVPVPPTRAADPQGPASRPHRAAPPPPPVAASRVSQQDLARVQVEGAGGPIRERILAHVDTLVRGMESLAQRISSDQLSSSQRTVLVSRFNEMERRVNEIDGIVGSEGREAQGQQVLRSSAGDGAAAAPPHQVAAADPGRGASEPAVTELRAAGNTTPRTVPQRLRDEPEMRPEAAAATADVAAAGIRLAGPDALQLAVSGTLVDMQA